MSGLEALSLAANIMQIITFASDATQLCKSVYNNGRLDPQLGILAVSLEAVAKEAQAHQANLATKTNIDLRLEEMASKCQIAARELGEEVQYLHKGSKQGDLAAAVRVTVKVNWRKRRLDRLEATLAKFQTAMQTQLLYRVWYVEQSPNQLTLTVIVRSRTLRYASNVSQSMTLTPRYDSLSQLMHQARPVSHSTFKRKRPEFTTMSPLGPKM